MVLYFGLGLAYWVSIVHANWSELSGIGAGQRGLDKTMLGLMKRIYVSIRFEKEHCL